MKNGQHMDSGKHPFRTSMKSVKPGTATMQGITGRVKGSSAPGTAANASMRRNPGKK